MPETMIDPKIQHHDTPAQSMRVPRILCVDDDPDFQTSMEIRLSAYHVDIDRAFYGMQGVFEAINSEPDLIIMDFAMPNGNGEYLLDCIKKNSVTSCIPVIVLTGMRDPRLKRRLLHAGAELFLQKPIDFDELLHHISRFIEIREQ